MSRTRKVPLPITGILLGAALAGSTWAAPSDQAAQDLAWLEKATNIVITEITCEVTNLTATNLTATNFTVMEITNRMVISQSQDVLRIVRTIHLRPKSPCRCAHTRNAVFETPAGEIRASFCSHCFDVSDQRNRASTRLYSMPQEFYAELLDQLRKRGAKGWSMLQH